MAVLNQRSQALHVALKVGHEAANFVDFYTLPELVVVLEAKDGGTIVLTQEQTDELAAVGMTFYPEFKDEWNNDPYPAITGPWE